MRNDDMIEFELRTKCGGFQSCLLLLRAEHHSELLDIGIGVQQFLLLADTLVQVEELLRRFARYRFFRSGAGHRELVEDRHVTTGCFGREVR